MIDIEKLVSLLNQADIPEGEREAWKNLIPLLPIEQIEELMLILQDEQEQLSALRQEYLQKVQNVVDGKTADN